MRWLFTTLRSFFQEVPQYYFLREILLLIPTTFGMKGFISSLSETEVNLAVIFFDVLEDSFLSVQLRRLDNNDNNDNKI